MVYYEFSIFKQADDLDEIKLEVSRAMNLKFTEGAWHMFDCLESKGFGFKVYLIPIIHKGNNCVEFKGDNAINDEGDYPEDPNLTVQDISGIVIHLLAPSGSLGWSVSTQDQASEFDYGIRANADWD